MSWHDLNFSDKEMNEFVKDFKAKTRFYLDEPVSPVVGETLEGQGYKRARPALLRAAGLRQHLDQHRAALVRRPDLARERDAHAVQPFATPKPQPESQPIHGNHRGLVGRLARKVSCICDQRLGVIPVHVFQNSGRGVGQGIRTRRPIVVGRDPVHRGEATDEVEIFHVEPPKAEVVEVHQ